MPFGFELNFLTSLRRFIQISPLDSDRVPQIGEDKETKERDISPPDDRISEEVDPLVVAGEILALKQR